MATYTCQICGSEFVHHFKKKTCSDECANRARSEAAEEQWADDDQRQEKLEGLREAMSREGVREHMRRTQLGEDNSMAGRTGASNPAYKGTATFECEWCTTEFEDYPSREGERRFCSRTCRALWQSENMRGENAGQWTGGMSTLECDHCGSEFQTYEYDRTNHNFCSKDCVYEWRSENLVGEDAPNWKGGYTENRGTNWPKLRSESLAANNRRCQGCGTGDSEHREEHGVGLHVHHIYPVTAFESPEDADTVDNLVPLCRDCHTEWEGIPLRPQLN